MVVVVGLSGRSDVHASANGSVQVRSVYNFFITAMGTVRLEVHSSLRANTCMFRGACLRSRELVCLFGSEQKTDKFFDGELKSSRRLNIMSLYEC